MLDTILFSVGGIFVTKQHLLLLTGVLSLFFLLSIALRYVSSKRAQIADDRNQGEVTGDPAAPAKNFAKENAEYLSSKLQVTTAPWEILFFIATTPENIRVTTEQLKKIQDMKTKKLHRLAALRAAKQNHNPNDLMDLDEYDGGWADSDDDDELLDEEARAAARAAKKHEEDTKKQARVLNMAMGKVDPTDLKLEGIDDGTIGQEWVVQRLQEKNIWPPQIPANAGTFEDAFSGEKVGPLEHPAIKRNLIMTLGRLNAMLLNSHPELAKANTSGNVDQTYFKNVLEFRQRSGLLLEVCLRIACAARSYRLVKTIVQTVAMFKIGVMNASDPRVLAWFHRTMQTQYGGPDGVPRLVIKKKSLATPGEDDICTGEHCIISVDIERVHAELFLKNKLELCRKQGIPPQIALQSFREVWWVLIRYRRTDGEENVVADPIPPPGSLAALASDIAKSEDRRYRLIHAYPFVVAQINKKEGTVKAQLKAPSTPGTYTYSISILSQEFLGCDVDIEIENVEIKDANLVKREKKNDTNVVVKEENSQSDEPKKDK